MIIDFNRLSSHKKIKWLLDDFHSRDDLNDSDIRLEALQNLAATKIFFKKQMSYKKRRDIASSGHKRKYICTRPCFVCKAPPPSLRHHIIQIQHGGDHRKKNIVALCKVCHGKIHPWLKN